MRQVIQVSGPVNNLVALCDDGTIWAYIAETTAWTQLPLVPGQAGTAEAAEASMLRDRAAIDRQERAEQARRERFQGTV
jgi:hypothetical protein